MVETAAMPTVETETVATVATAVLVRLPVSEDQLVPAPEVWALQAALARPVPVRPLRVRPDLPVAERAARLTTVILEHPNRTESLAVIRAWRDDLCVVPSIPSLGARQDSL